MLGSNLSTIDYMAAWTGILGFCGFFAVTYWVVYESIHHTVSKEFTRKFSIIGYSITVSLIVITFVLLAIK